MGAAGKLLESGRLGIVPGVGYPNPNRSHFASMAIWQTARLDPEEHARPRLARPGARLGRRGVVGPSSASGSIPVAIKGRRALASGAGADRRPDLRPLGRPARRLRAAEGDDLAAFVRRSTLDAYASSDRLAELARDKAASARYPGTALGERLKLVARLLKGGYASRVFYTSQGRLRHPLGAGEPAFRPARRALRGDQGVPRRPGRLEAGRPGPGPLLQRVRPPGPRERLGRDRPRRRRPGPARRPRGQGRPARHLPQPGRPRRRRPQAHRRLPTGLRHAPRRLARPPLRGGPRRVIPSVALAPRVMLGPKCGELNRQGAKFAKARGERRREEMRLIDPRFMRRSWTVDFISWPFLLSSSLGELGTLAVQFPPS